jgi:Domain of unknown function (DUF4395)
MEKIIAFGEQVPGYDIPVLNEREIRAAAGILFLVIFTALLVILFKGDFVLAKYSITFFLIDFIIRVFISPRFSPTLILGRLIVRNQTPEYVGAKQKKFAWKIGVVLSGTMFIFFLIVNAYSPITGIICLMCLIFLFFESAFGICLACKLYAAIYRDKVQYCPGEVCDVKSKQDIQKTSGAQWLALLGFVVFIFIVVSLFNNEISKPPFDLFGISGSAKSK